MTTEHQTVADLVEQWKAAEAGLTAQQQEAAEHASERLAAEDIEQVRNDAQKWVLAQEPLRELEELRHELAVAREKVESLWLQRERQRATINGLHDQLGAAVEAEALVLEENEELRAVIHDAAEKLEGALHSSRLLADDVMEVVRELREAIK